MAYESTKQPPDVQVVVVGFGDDEDSADVFTVKDGRLGELLLDLLGGEDGE